MAMCVYFIRSKSKIISNLKTIYEIKNVISIEIKDKQNIGNSSSTHSISISRGSETTQTSNIFTTLPNYYQASKMKVEQHEALDILPTYFKLFNSNGQRSVTNNI